MTQTTFLHRDQYWQEIAARVPGAKKVIAAVAYLGSGGMNICRCGRGMNWSSISAWRGEARRHRSQGNPKADAQKGERFYAQG